MGQVAKNRRFVLSLLSCGCIFAIFYFQNDAEIGLYPATRINKLPFRSPLPFKIPTNYPPLPTSVETQSQDGANATAPKSTSNEDNKEEATEVPENVGSITRQISNRQENETKETNITILFWNSYFIWKYYGMGYRNKGFIKAGCKYTNCYTTTNRKKIIDNNTRIDAVLVHSFEEKLAHLAAHGEVERIVDTNQGKLPAFIYLNKEAMSPDDDQRFKTHPDLANLFNIIYTFRTDSTVNFPYGRVIDRNIKHLMDAPPLSETSWLEPPKQLPKKIATKDFGHKTKDILWMVSHCDTWSKREKYVDKLRKATNLTIDVLGKCGKDVLGSETSKSLDETENSREQMYIDQLREYKFYLAFENNYCEDYHTEKIFSALKTEDVIPVVMGGKSPSDLTRVAPPRSYLNTEDFKSIEELAKQLEYLATNTDAYREYFWWTNHYRVASTMEGYESAQCHLCELLNKVHKKETVLTNVDLRDYWSSEKHCRYPGKDKFAWT